ncbi:hypothetical protein G6011_09395 [Alternaria panax]|uniref:Heterokaryon incompatibility protein n=1 Tax=Alternaria panax TaxID=48097 RepID=A0AAD4IAY7_9PLEO|nr:hypothetical protein G6011_09395 [Alternaria panax]
MADIYENAHVTVAVTFAKDSNVGLFSSTLPVVRRLDKHPHLHVKCRSHFHSEDASEDRIWRLGTDQLRNALSHPWGHEVGDLTTQWQKLIAEYTELQLTYGSDRLSVIAALADRVSRLRKADDVYIARIWKNSILLDLMWSTASSETRPMPSAPSGSWASTHNAKTDWVTTPWPIDFAKVISLDYASVSAPHVGEVINASIVLRAPVIPLTGVNLIYQPRQKPWEHDKWLSDFLRSSPFGKSFQRHNFGIHTSILSRDYDLTTADPPYQHGHIVELLVMGEREREYGSLSLCGLAVRQIQDKPVAYERIGFVSVMLFRVEQPGEIDMDITVTKLDLWESSIDDLIHSLPVKQVKIF